MQAEAAQQVGRRALLEARAGFSIEQFGVPDDAVVHAATWRPDEQLFALFTHAEQLR